MNKHDLEAIDAVRDAVDFLGACDLLDELESHMTPEGIAIAEATIKARFRQDVLTELKAQQ